jgi:hypothetical protein
MSLSIDFTLTVHFLPHIVAEYFYYYLTINISDILGCIVLLCISLINLEVLSIFGLLNPTITPRFIYKCRLVIISTYLTFNLIWYFNIFQFLGLGSESSFSHDKIYANILSACTILWLVFVVVWDNWYRCLTVAKPGTSPI